MHMLNHTVQFEILTSAACESHAKSMQHAESTLQPFLGLVSASESSQCSSLHELNFSSDNEIEES